MTFEPKYKKLIENQEISRWFENVRAKSYLTATVYLRGLGYYCELTGASPESIIADAKSGTLRKDFMEFVRKMERDGKAGSYIARYKKVLRSWLGFNGIDFKFGVNIAYENRSPRVEGERIPEKTELIKMLRNGTPRARLAMSLLAFSGLRPETLGNAEGTDGLKISDFPEMKIVEGTIEFEKVPTIVYVRYTLSKGRNTYFTFLGQEGITYLKEYLEARIKGGDKLKTETPLFGLDPQGRITHDFIRTQIATRDIRTAITGSGYSWRPYVLRAYFATALDNAENKGLISHPWRMFFMGHKGDIEARYSTNKRLPPDMVEEMRGAYVRASKFFETEERGIKEEDYTRIQRETAIMMLEMAFKTTLTDEQKEEIMALELSEFQKRLGEMFQEKRMQELNNGNKHKTISERDLETYLNRGWELVQIYPKGDKAVIKLPS
ncbi:MAG: site-specific integrase [Candidatus Thermoplasmatota archaeon]|nr:site-specific integrase [Candidatus Thermoplasmatota archaeon]